jgi:N-methylhydantoinase A/oxoprolinase/acetone carboxylase beta subunit
VVGTRPIEPVTFPAHDDAGSDASAAVKGQRNVFFEPVGYTPTSVYDGEALKSGNVLAGPAIVERMGDSVVVPPGYEAAVDRYLTMRLSAVPSDGEAASGGVESRIGVV